LLKDEYPDAEFGEAVSAQQALECAWERPWDLIILDISMPGRSGLDVLRDLVQARPGTPVLVQSMHSESHFAMRVLRAGALGYITKDSMPDELIRAVRKLLTGGRYVSLSLAEKLAEFLSGNSDSRAPHEALSDREFQILRMLASGRVVKDIGAELNLSIKTISTYRTRLLEKLQLRTNAELAQYALREGLLD
jgi:DNA-binding NarL/FixJ family response regulator